MAEQLLMRAMFDDVAVFHVQDQVGIADRGEPVRDDEARMVRHQCVHRLRDCLLGARVDRVRRLIEDEHRRVGEEHAVMR